MPIAALIAAASIATTAPPPLCSPLPGAAAVLADRAVARVVMTEVRGTLELPALFGDLVCAAAEARGPVTVALDYPPGEQGELGAFLASDGGPAATQRFLAQKRWAQLDQDGRASVGVFRLIDRLRRLMAEGKVAAVVSSQPPGPAADASFTLILSDTALAPLWRTTTRTLVLHATSLGGRAWNCERTCDYRAIASDGPPERGLSAAGTLDLGGKLTPALPAARFAERERIRQAGAWGFFDDLFP